MPQVPYLPVPKASAQMIPTPKVHEDTPSQAFGVNVGEGISSVGRATEQVGNELWQRATALQNLQNETEAKEADANYMIEAGKLHAEYGTLKGKAAVDGYEPYIQSLKDLRTKMRDGLSNPMARRMFDGSSLSVMSRTIFNGAGHAGEENRRWAVGAASARIDGYGNNVYQNPEDDGLYEQSIRVVQAETEDTLAPAQGWGTEQTGMEVNKRISKITAQRIIGMSRKDPYRAQEMFEKYKENLHDNDRFVTENAVQNQMRAVGSENIAQSIYTRGRGEEDKPGKSLREMEDEARAIAKKTSPNDPELPKHAVSAVQRIFNQDKYAKRQEDIENWGTVQQAILDGADSEQKLRADPKVAKAIDDLPKDKRLAIPRAINSYLTSRNKQAHEEEYLRLYGLSNNDVGQFLEQDIMGNDKLSAAQKIQMIKLQNDRKKNPSEDPRVLRALNWMRTAHGSELQALDVYYKTVNNTDKYLQYQGALQVALDEYQQANKKSADYKTVVEDIGPKIIQQRSEPMFFGLMTTKKPFFEQEVPDKFANEIKADIQDKGGVEPTAEQIYRAYLRYQWSQMHKGSAGGGKSDKLGPNAQPR